MYSQMGSVHSCPYARQTALVAGVACTVRVSHSHKAACYRDAYPARNATLVVLSRKRDSETPNYLSPPNCC